MKAVVNRFLARYPKLAPPKPTISHDESERLQRVADEMKVDGTLHSPKKPS